jgi:hypothetical protein
MKMKKTLLNKYSKDLYGKRYLNSEDGTRVIDIEIMDNSGTLHFERYLNELEFDYRLEDGSYFQDENLSSCNIIIDENDIKEFNEAWKDFKQQYEALAYENEVKEMEGEPKTVINFNEKITLAVLKKLLKAVIKNIKDNNIRNEEFIHTEFGKLNCLTIYPKYTKGLKAFRAQIEYTRNKVIEQLNKKLYITHYDNILGKDGLRLVWEVYSEEQFDLLPSNAYDDFLKGKDFTEIVSIEEYERLGFSQADCEDVNYIYRYFEWEV